MIVFANCEKYLSFLNEKNMILSKTRVRMSVLRWYPQACLSYNLRRSNWGSPSDETPKTMEGWHDKDPSLLTVNIGAEQRPGF